MRTSHHAAGGTPAILSRARPRLRRGSSGCRQKTAAAKRRGLRSLVRVQAPSELPRRHAAARGRARLSHRSPPAPSSVPPGFSSQPAQRSPDAQAHKPRPGRSLARARFPDPSPGLVRRPSHHASLRPSRAGRKRRGGAAARVRVALLLGHCCYCVAKKKKKGKNFA